MHQKRRDKLAAARNPQPIPPNPQDQAAKRLESRVQEVDGQIDSVTRKLSKATEPRDMQALAMALDRLYGIWSLLTGHPRPGVRKDKPKRSIQTYGNPTE
jgi:hypothetical protein